MLVQVEEMVTSREHTSYWNKFIVQKHIARLLCVSLTEQFWLSTEAEWLTARYESPLPINPRLCPVCVTLVEDELRSLFQNPLSDDLRIELFIRGSRLNDGCSTRNDKWAGIYIFLFIIDDLITYYAKSLLSCITAWKIVFK